MSLEIIIGPMFSGKTSYAISYIKRQQVLNKKVLVIKPQIDNRYSNDNMITSHNKESYPCINWDSSIYLYIHNDIITYDCIVIEEAQFFKGLVDIVKSLLFLYKKDILLVGLNGDAKQCIFGELLYCIPFSTKLLKLEALCTMCNDGTSAHYSKKIMNDMIDDQVNVGGIDKYSVVCLKHL